MKRGLSSVLVSSAFTAVIAVWVFWPAMHGSILLWDDVEFLKEATSYHALTLHDLGTVFTTTYGANYNPLTTLSHTVVCRLWKMDPMPHHAVNLFLHAINVGLAAMFVWTLLDATNMFGRREQQLATACVALAFAIHPLQVESVAWVSERKTLLYTAFSLSCLVAYIKQARVATVTLFVLALFSKAMAAPLPAVMLLLDHYPLRRDARLGWRRLVWEKLPLFAMSAAVSAVVVRAHAAGHVTMTLQQLGLSSRCLVAARGVIFYVGKLLWPAALSPYYPLDGPVSLRELEFSLSLALWVTITILAILCRRRWPVLFTGWFAYLALILPTSGLIQAGAQAAADRYMYLAMLPLLLLFAWIFVWAWRQFAALGRLALVALLACNFAFWGFRTRGQVFAWHDDESLWRAVLVQYPNCGLANAALARTLIDEGQIDEALEHAARAVKIAPWVGDAHSTLAMAYLAAHRYAEAEREAERALRQDPTHAQTLFALACACARLGKLDAAYETLTKLLSLHPNYAGYALQSEDLASVREHPQFEEKFRQLVATESLR